MKLKIISTIILSLLLCSCGLFLDKNLAKRYRNNWNSNTFDNSSDPQSFVKVELNTTLIVETKEKELKYNVLTLTDKGQEAFINAVNSKTTASQDLLNLINSNFNFTQSEKSKIKIIPKTIKKTLIFTVDRPYAVKDASGGTTFNTMGDRVSFLELSLKISNNNNAKFNSWDKYVTDKLTLNLGKVSSAQNWNASLNVSAKGAGEVSLTGSNSTEEFSSDKENNAILVNTGNNGSNSNNYELLTTGKEANNKVNGSKVSGELGGSATVGYSDKYETSVDLSSQILKLSGSLSEKKMFLRQEGGPGIDLSGNIVVSVEYVLNDEWATPVQFSKLSNLYSSSGVPNLTTVIKKTFLMLVYPDIQNDVIGELDYSFLYRQVNRGNKHLPESRHKVTFRYGSVLSKDNKLITSGAVDLIKKQDIRPKIYLLRLNGTNSNLQLENKNLIFETVSEAATFLAYLNDLAVHSIPLTNISVGINAITHNDIPNLKIITEQL